MAIRRFEVERFSVVSSRPFEEVVDVIRAQIGHPDMAEFRRATDEARTLADLEDAIRPRLGATGLMLFLELDLGAILRKETNRESRIMRFLIGNPLVMKEMAKHVPDAGSYAPVTVLADERPDGVHLSYDKMASFLAPYGNADTLAVAQDLDSKIISLLEQAAG
jgi:hypothetical protein